MVTCNHLSDADKLNCPICSRVKTKKARQPKYLSLYGYTVKNVPQTFTDALALNARLKKAAARRARKSTKRSAK